MSFSSRMGKYEISIGKIVLHSSLPHGVILSWNFQFQFVGLFWKAIRLYAGHYQLTYGAISYKKCNKSLLKIIESVEETELIIFCLSASPLYIYAQKHERFIRVFHVYIVYFMERITASLQTLTRRLKDNLDACTLMRTYFY